VLLAPGAVLLRRAEVLERAEARDRIEPSEALAADLARVVEMDVEAVAAASGPLRRGQRDAEPAGPGPMPSCLATYSCFRRCASSRLREKSPSYFAQLKSASSPRLSRKTRSVNE
jgi:hypothetical protein